MDIGEVRSIEGYLYILQSKSTGNYYVGSTCDLEKRILEHNGGLVKSTRSKIPLEIRFFKKFNSIKEARQVEYKLKTFKNRKIIEKIIEEQELKLGL